MNKRKRITVFIGMLLFFSVVYIMFSDRNEEILRGNITIWSNSNNYDYLNKYANKFMKLNSKTNINVEKIEPYNYESKLENGFKTGNLPNIVEIDSYSLANLNPQYKETLLINKEDSIVNTYRSNFNESRLKEIEFDDNVLLGIPLTSRPLMLFLRQDIMGLYGYNHEDINTWNELISMGKDIYEKSNGKIRVLNATDQDYSDLVYLLIMQAMEQYDTEEEIINDVESKITLLKDNNILNLENGGEFLARISSINGLRELEALDVECSWTANNAPAKENGSNRFYVAEGNNLVIVNRDEQNSELIRRFIGFLSTNTEDSIDYIVKDRMFLSFKLAYHDSRIDVQIKNFNGKSPLITMSNITEKAPTIKDYRTYRNVKKYLLNK